VSQAGQINSAAGPVPPTVPTIFETDQPVGTNEAIPQNNILIVTGGNTTDNNPLGIETYANPTGSMGSNNLVIELTNRYQRSDSFSDSSSHQLYSQNLGITPAVYIFIFTLLALDTTANLGACFQGQIVIRTDGATATGIPEADQYIVFEEPLAITLTYGKLAPNSFHVTVQNSNNNDVSYNLTGTYQMVT